MELEKITMPLADLTVLEAELNGFSHPETGEVLVKGFINEKINLGVKYRLSDLSDFLLNEKKKLEGIRNDLIKKYGEEKNGNIGIETFLDEAKTQVNPKFIEFQNEYNELLSLDKEVSYFPIPVSELDKIDSEANYKLIFKLVKK